jgi:hypothetical protein
MSACPINPARRIGQTTEWIGACSLQISVRFRSGTATRSEAALGYSAKLCLAELFESEGFGSRYWALVPPG